MIPWHDISGRPIQTGRSFGLMGILNVTPDSFYDGGQFINNEAIGARASALVADGADIVDIGAESTRPGFEPVPPDVEWARIAPALAAVRRDQPEAVISVDTRHASTAALAIESGAAIINDVSGSHNFEDPGMLELLAERKPGYVLMHGWGANAALEPRASCPACSAGGLHIIADMKKFFGATLSRLVQAGLPENRVVLDPGIGFGKNLDENLIVMRHLGEFLEFGRPLLLGVSMKSFFGRFLGLPLAERGLATAVTTALLYEKGAFWHRVHDVGAARTALELARALTESPGASPQS